MPLLIAALLAISAALIVLYPLLGLSREAAPEQTAPAQVGDAAERERLARQALREVEFDYTLGNLESDDYDELRERYEVRALAALKTRYQREQELDALIERRLDALRQAESAPAATATRLQAPAATAPAAAKTAPATQLPAGGASSERARTPGASVRSVRDRRASRRKGS